MDPKQNDTKLSPTRRDDLALVALATNKGWVGHSASHPTNVARYGYFIGAHLREVR